MKAEEENSTRNLFNPEDELRPGETISADGDVYNEKGLVREAPSPELIKARRMAEKEGIAKNDPRFDEMARFYLRQIKAGKKKKTNE